jgi:hypothetical protein
MFRTVALLAAATPDSGGLWNQTKVVGVIVAAMVVGILVTAASHTFGAKKHRVHDIAEWGLKIFMIVGVVAITVGGLIWALADKLAQLGT